MNPTDKSGLRAPAADFLRVASIAIVGWYHIWQQSWLNPNFTVFGFIVDIYPMIRTGYMFVYNLILISGFVLMLGRYSGRYKGALKFYKSRAIRILPNYLFCIAVFLILSNQPGGKYDWFGGREHMRLDLIAHLTFTQNLFMQSYTNTGLNVALWTLAVEMQFYLIFPLIGKCFEKHPLVTYFAMWAVSLMSKLYVFSLVEDTTMYINRLPAMLDVFANGMLAAFIFCRLKDTRQPGAVHLVLLLTSCAGMYFVARDVSFVTGSESQRIAQLFGASLFSVFGSVFLISGSLGWRGTCLVMSNPPIRFLSGITYNFYIWHQSIAVWLKQLHIPDYAEEYPNMSGNIVWQRLYSLYCVLFALLAAFLFTYLIEKPA
ncbi:MAG: acyltransferase, partial [Clostridia bacterium]|nr:acyltransferase [Clostridia bacterium]